MPTLAEFYAEVSSEIKRGTSLDAQIPTWARNACRWLESDYDYNYMQTVARFDYSYGDTVAAPARLKKIEYLREITPGLDDTEEFRDILPANSGEITSTQAEIYYWWQEGANIVFDGVPTDEVNLIWAYYQYTDPTIWTGVTSVSPSILTHAYNPMLYRTLLNFATSRRDQALIQSYTGELMSALNTEQRADYAKSNPGPIRRNYNSLY